MKIRLISKNHAFSGLKNYLMGALGGLGHEFETGSQYIQGQLSILDYETFDAVHHSNKLNCLLAIDMNETSDEQLQYLKRFLEKNTSAILGVIDLSRPFVYALPMIRVVMEQQVQQIDRLLVQSLEGLKKVRQIHEKVVPLRCEKIKGLSVYGKYAAGLGSGGEFYDIIKNDDGLFLFMSSSNSYVASSLVLSHFDLFKRNKCSQQALNAFITDLEAELTRLGQKEHAGVYLVALQYHAQTLNLSGHMFGKFWGQGLNSVQFTGNNLIISNSLKEKAQLNVQLEPESRFAIISPGLLTNLPVSPYEKFLKEFINDNLSKGAKFLLDEIFYTLKREDVDNFLNFDSTALILEVDDHVLHKI